MNPIANTYYANLPDGRTLIWGRYSDGRVGWIQVTSAGGPINTGLLTYSNLNDGSWVNMQQPPLAFGFFASNFADIGPSAVRAVPGSPAQAIPAPAPQGGDFWGRSQFDGQLRGANAVPPQPGAGAQQSIAPALVQLLAAQQANAAAQAILTQANTGAQAAAAFGDFVSPCAYLAQGIALSLGATSAQGLAQASGTFAGVLVSLLGAQALPQLSTVIQTLNDDAAAAGNLADIANGFNSFQTGVKAVLSTVQNNQLVGTIAAGGGNGDVSTLLGVMLGQNAITAFNTATPASGPLLADIQASFAAFVNAWSALAASMTTNAIISALA